MATSMRVEAEKVKKSLELKNQSHPSQKKQMPQTRKTAIAKKSNCEVKVQSPKAGGIHNMTKAEARDAIKTIKKNLCSLMEICHELETRKGYRALGYPSFKECVAKELVDVVEYDYAIKLKNAGQVHMSVCPEIPMGEVSEGVFRPLFTFPDATKKKVWNIAVKKYGDYKKITGAILKEIIKSRGIAASAKGGKSETKANTKKPITANGQKDVLNPKIIINKKLQSGIRASLLELLKQDNVNNKHRPASQKSFEEALDIMLDDIFDFLSGHYENIYGEESSKT